MAFTAEQRQQHPSGDHVEISAPPTRDGLKMAYPMTHPSRSVSVERLCSLSGMVLAGVIAVLSWALYSLSPNQADLRPLRSSAAQEIPPRAAAAVMLASSDNPASLPTVPVVAPDPVVSSPAVKAPDEAPAQVFLHIQSPAQQKLAERLAEQLEEKGYIVPKAAILESKGPSRTEIRYFSPLEAEEATAIAMLVSQPYRAPATSSYIRGRKDASKAQARRYEIWFGPEPRSPKVRHSGK
jgi:hypothetical protein